MPLEKLSGGLRINGKRINENGPLIASYSFAKAIETYLTGHSDGYSSNGLVSLIKPTCQDISKIYMSALTKK